MALELLLADLESNRLEVALVPQKRHTNEGGMIRVCMSKNCRWYREFCARHSSSRVRNHRKHDTRIKRADTVRLLERLIAGAATRSKYAEELLSIARWMAA